MSRSFLSYGLSSSLDSQLSHDVTLTAEPFSFSEDSDTSLPSFSSLLSIAMVEEEDIEEAIAQWKDDYAIARYRNILEANPED